jgi:glutamyl-Q tRNA(Asp) synthetase
LAVLVDDHDVGVTDVVRGADLIDNTPRQIQLLNALGWDVPRYMHIPLVLNDRQEKLSKQAGALALSDDLLEETERAWTHLGFERIGADRLSAFYPIAIEQWKEKFRI